MAETSFASLSPTLLAKKGGAKPAMRSQASALPQPVIPMDDLDDLGWNDMGDDEAEGNVVNLSDAAEARANTKRSVIPSEAREQPVANDTTPLVRKSVRASRRRGSGKPAKERAAFTLRLDQQRHLMLKLACTVRDCSAQQLVTDALDALLAEMPDVERLATQIKHP